jgi:hypothetical protein
MLNFVMAPFLCICASVDPTSSLACAAIASNGLVVDHTTRPSHSRSHSAHLLDVEEEHLALPRHCKVTRINSTHRCGDSRLPTWAHLYLRDTAIVLMPCYADTAASSILFTPTTEFSVDPEMASHQLVVVTAERLVPSCAGRRCRLQASHTKADSTFSAAAETR